MKLVKIFTCLIMVLSIIGLSACDSGSSGGYSRPSFNFNNSYNGGNGSNESSSQGSVQKQQLTSGTYTFYNAADYKYLSFSDRQLKLDVSIVNWKLRPAKNGFYVYSCSNDLLLDIDNAYVANGTTVKLWENTGYNTQIWKVVANSDNTYSFISSADENYCLGFSNGKAVLQLRKEGDKSQEWYAAATVDYSPKNYREYISQGGIVEVRLPLNITDVISGTRLQQWANDLEKAYFTYEELTGYRPYEFIIVKAYEPITRYENVLAYVFDNNNTIYVDSNFIPTDLAKMAKRVNDWNFCVLHEMGHMFDNGRPWNFEAEVMTDLKIPYVLEQNGAGAELSQFGEGSVRYGKDIMYSYQAMSGDLSKEYDIFALAYKFMQIKEQIGWQPFKSTFHKLQQDEALYYNYTKRQKFDLFISTLSSYSGQNIKGYFTSAEWNSILAKLN